MLKPRGAICNLDCDYCYFLSKEKLYPDSTFRMEETLLEDYTRQYIEAQRVPEVTFAWQGGEPTLMGLDFFRQAVAYQEKYRKPGMQIQNALQTNGTTLTDEWCAFFHEHSFLIGISIDGPGELHDGYRVDKGGRPTLKNVLRGVELLKKHHVEFNVLTCVHANSAEHPLEVYRFLRDEVGARYMQFIPIVERANDTGFQEGSDVTERSVTGAQYGQFLSAVFDEWVRRDVSQVFVQIFDVALAAWLGQPPGLCIFEETCGSAMAMEHNGDVFSCDHFVEPAHKLGNMAFVPLADLVNSEQQFRFGQAKRDTLPQFCRDCDVRFVCNGGCPKNRFITTPDGEPGLNYLCDGYKSFFTHIDGPVRLMASEFMQGRPPANIMIYLAREQKAREQQFAGVGRNDPCPCGSGKKFKHCCGKRTS
ncbi:anaerobic sulfatase maturase [Aggregatilinea lenta]|uniref:anaerobic sulfatase maturase n=1 Tax=Aggregatilinea lenta TaxID=913108 RepID=UPI000E5B6811|nr:anaerobic sulfatase maturase [Aggregatilinea lenta]